MARPKQPANPAHTRVQKAKFAFTNSWRPAIAPPTAIIVGGMVIWILQGAINLFRTSEPYWWAHGWATQALAVVITIFAALAVLRVLCPRATPGQLTFAGWSWFFVPGLICASVLPGAMILFVLPAVGFLIASALWVALREPKKGLFNTPLGWVYGAAALLVLIVFTPLFSALGITLGYGTGWMFAVVFGIALLPAFGAFTPAWHYEGTITVDPPVWVTGLATIGLFSTAMYLPAATPQTPRPQNIVTVINADEDQAHIAFTHNTSPEASPAAPFKDLKRRNLLPDRRAMWSVPAAMPDGYAPPKLTNIDKTYRGNGTIEIWGTLEANGADRVGIRVPTASRPQTATFWDITAPLSDEDGGRDYVVLRCAGQSCNGSLVGFSLKKDVPLAWILYGEYFKTTDSARPYVDARPGTDTPIQSGDHTVVFAKQTP